METAICFERYRSFIEALPMRDRYVQEQLLVADLLIGQGDGLDMYYAPFDWINHSAKVILLGITPGWTQMEIAFRTARAASVAGVAQEEIDQLVKRHASFAGSMRKNLVGMLDALGLPSLLRIGSSSELFGTADHLLHTTSAIRYPAFCGARNYSGGNPRLVRSPFLLTVARQILAPEVSAIPEAAIIPLGKSAEEVLAVLAAEGRIRNGRWLCGFPHPSGANGHRLRLFQLRRQSLANQLRTILGASDPRRNAPTYE